LKEREKETGMGNLKNEIKVSNEIRSKILIDALPYIQRYNGKIVVVKYGGNAMTNEELKNAVMSDIVLLSLVGVKVVLVHGGGPEINDMLKRVGIESKFINGLRYTDEATVDIVKMVLAGKVNKELVSHLIQHGVVFKFCLSAVKFNKRINCVSNGVVCKRNIRVVGILQTIIAQLHYFCNAQIVEKRQPVRRRYYFCIALIVLILTQRILRRV